MQTCTQESNLKSCPYRFVKCNGTSRDQNAVDLLPAERMGEQIRAVCPWGA